MRIDISGTRGLSKDVQASMTQVQKNKRYHLVITWYLHGNSAVIKSLTDSWLWSAKGFPFFLFKMFKGINQPQSTLNFSFFVSIHGGHATEELRANKNSRFPLALMCRRRKSLQDVLEAMDWRDVPYWCTMRDYDGTVCSDNPDTIWLFFFVFVPLSKRETHKHTSAAKFGSFCLC